MTRLLHTLMLFLPTVGFSLSRPPVFACLTPSTHLFQEAFYGLYEDMFLHKTLSSIRVRSVSYPSLTLPFPLVYSMDQSMQKGAIKGLFSLGIKWDSVHRASGDSGQGVTIMVGDESIGQRV